MKSRVSAALLLVLCLTASAANAQLARVGNTFSTTNGLVRGSAVGYDSVNDVYLTVGAHGTFKARFVSAEGTVLGLEIPLVGAFPQFPNVAFSPDTGSFLVTWYDQARAWAQLIKYPTGVASVPIPISPGDLVYEVFGAPVAYSTVTKEFLVVFRNYSTFDILGVRVANSGVPVGAPFSVSVTASQPEPFFRNSPSVGYNPTTDEFFVAYRAGSPAGAYVRRVKAGTAQLVGEPILLGSGAHIFVTAVTHMPATGQMMAAWHQMPADAVFGRVINANGSLPGNVTPLSSRYGTYDSLSIASNGLSGTVLVVGHDKLDYEDGGVEIETTGMPIGTGMSLTAAGAPGNFHPEVVGHTARREWLLSASNGFARTIAQRVASSTPGGGGPPPAPSDPRMELNTPVNGTSFTGPISVVGWAVDVAATSGTGIDRVETWAFPVSGTPFPVGFATLGARRAECAGFGERFVPCGFSMTFTLPPGTYDLNVYAFSTVAQAFNQSRSVRIQVAFPVSERVAIGLGPLPNEGGWLNIRNAVFQDPGLGVWAGLNWPAYRASGKGLHLAAGDVDGDGLDEIVAGLGSGSDGWIAIFDDAAHGSALLKWIQLDWPAYNAANGEVFPAVGDLDGDGIAEIVAGMGQGGQGYIAIFNNPLTSTAPPTWRRVVLPLYDLLGTGETHPAVGNVDGAGANEIIVGLGRGSGGFAQVFTGAASNYTPLSWIRVDWPAYNIANGSTFPAAGDLDGDGRAEVVLGLGQGGGGWLQVLDDAVGAFAHSRWIRVSWPAYNSTGSGETHPAVGNIDGDGRAEIVVGLDTFPGHGGWLESFDDTVGGNASLGWQNVNWDLFKAHGGATFPAIGRFR